MATASLAVPLAVLPVSRSQAAGGAFVVDDASIADLNTCQVESWLSLASNRDVTAVATPACTVNLGLPVEIDSQFQRSRSGGAHGSWQSTVLLQGKISPVPIETGKAGLALSGGVHLDLTTGGVLAVTANVPVTFALTETVRVNGNAGWLYDNAHGLHSALWGASVEWDLSRQSMVLAEVFGQTGRRPEEPPSVTGPRMQAGLRFTPIDTVDIDVIYGRNITGERAHWVTVGLSMRFGVATPK
jgi:hypothetical protein